MDNSNLREFRKLVQRVENANSAKAILEKMQKGNAVGIRIFNSGCDFRLFEEDKFYFEFKDLLERYVIETENKINQLESVLKERGTGTKHGF